MAYKKEIDTLVGEILESYGRHPETCSINMRNRVNKEIVIDILEEIRCIVFPGYFEVKNLNENSIEYHVGELLEDISYRLRKQVAKALYHAGTKKFTDEEMPPDRRRMQPAHLSPESHEAPGFGLKTLLRYALPPAALPHL